MKSLICMASLAAALSLASPICAATVTYDFEAVGGAGNPDGRLVGQLSYDLDGAPLFAEDRFLSRHSNVGQIEATIVGGKHAGMIISPEPVTFLSAYLNIANIFFARSENISFLMQRRNAPFIAANDLTLLSFDAATVWVRPDFPGAKGPQSYSLTAVSANQLVSVPLPATFPLLLGACLGAAFVGRKRSEI